MSISVNKLITIDSFKTTNAQPTSNASRGVAKETEKKLAAYYYTDLNTTFKTDIDKSSMSEKSLRVIDDKEY